MVRSGMSEILSHELINTPILNKLLLLCQTDKQTGTEIIMSTY